MITLINNFPFINFLITLLISAMQTMLIFNQTIIHIAIKLLTMEIFSN